MVTINTKYKVPNLFFHMGSKKHNTGNTCSAECICTICLINALYFYYYCYFSFCLLPYYSCLVVHFLKFPLYLKIWYVFWNYTLMSQILLVLPVLSDLVNSDSYLNLHILKFVLRDRLLGIGIMVIFVLIGIIQKGFAGAG